MVSRSVEECTATVCVLNSGTLGTDEDKNVKDELRAAKNYNNPLFVLANKIDMAPVGKAGSRTKLLIEQIGKGFIDSDYDEQRHKTFQQVYGVSALDCLNPNLMSRAYNTDHKLFWEEMRSLANPEIAPDLMSEKVINYHATSKNYSEDFYHKMLDVLIDYDKADWR